MTKLIFAVASEANNSTNFEDISIRRSPVTEAAAREGKLYKHEQDK